MRTWLLNVIVHFRQGLCCLRLRCALFWVVALTHRCPPAVCSFLASVGQDDDHTVGVYDWAAGKLKVSAVGDKNKSLGVAFSPDGSTVCQVGVSHIRFHEIQGRNVKTTRGILKKKGLLQPFLAVVYLGASAMVGTSDGHIYQFSGTEIKTAIKVCTCVGFRSNGSCSVYLPFAVTKIGCGCCVRVACLIVFSQAHTGPVHALYSCSTGLVSGGKDGIVKVWSPLMDLVGEYNMKERGAFMPAIRSVCWDPLKKRMLVGTVGSEIFEVCSILLFRRWSGSGGHSFVCQKRDSVRLR